MELAARNAAETLAREQARWLADQGKTLAALEELAAALGLAAPPLRIECYDISTIQGTNTVGSMVVFEEGRPRSGEYRRFRVRTPAVRRHPDDFATHREVLRRRFCRALEAEEGSAEELRWRLPDLVIIDGGHGPGQRRPRSAGLAWAARHAGDRSGQGARGALPARTEPAAVLLPNSQALYLVQRLRDEAHRFAITYHRQLRAKARRSQCSTTCQESVRPQARASCGCSDRPDQMRSATSRRSPRSPASSRSLAEKIHEGLTSRPSLNGFLTVASVKRPCRLVPMLLCYSPAGMRRFLPVLILMVGLAALAVNFLPLGRPFSEPPTPIDTRLGLDLQGGLRGEYRALPTETSPITPQTLADIRTIIENRINQYGVAEPIVQTQGSDRIVVEIPGVSNEQEVRSLIGSTGRLDFVEVPPARASEVQPGQTDSAGPQGHLQWRPDIERRARHDPGGPACG